MEIRHSIERFHSRGQYLCKFIGTKESVCIRKEFNSHRTGLGHQHGRRFIVLGHQYGRRFIVLGHQYGRRDVVWKHSIDNKLRWAGQVRHVRRFSHKVVVAFIWECGWECKRDRLPSHRKAKAQTAWAYPGFISMKHLGVLLLLPGRDASPSQGHPSAVCRRYPFIHQLGEERQSGVKFLV